MARVVTTTTAVKTAAAVSEVMCACLSARARAGGWPQRARATAVAVQMSRTPYTASCGRRCAGATCLTSSMPSVRLMRRVSDFLDPYPGVTCEVPAPRCLPSTDSDVRSDFLPNLKTGRRRDYPTKSTMPVDRLYIAPVILTVPFFSSSSRSGLRRRISPSPSATLVRATAST